MKSDHSVGFFLIDLAVLIALGRCLGWCLVRVRQPPVLGEILAGILIGPSLLGAIAPGVTAALFPPETTQLLAGAGAIGLVLFVFLVGLEMDSLVIRAHLREVAAISVGSLVVPFAFGALLSIPLYSSHSVVGTEIPQLPFTLFIGTALSVTAFPVLSRILTDQGLTDTSLGVISISAAAILDLAGWILLAVVLVLLAGGGGDDFVRITLELLAFGITMMALVVPLLRRVLKWMQASGRPEIEQLPVVVIAVVVCSGFTELIGLHSVLGALVLGLVFPRDDCEQFVNSTRQTVLPMTAAVLLPVYFAMSGMGVDLTQLGGSGLLEIGAITIVATAAKLGGAAAGARRAGLAWPEGFAIGVLMNTRGLIEVVMLNVGRAAGLLDDVLYSELILVALITTFMTGPALSYLRSRSSGPLWEGATRSRQGIQVNIN